MPRRHLMLVLAIVLTAGLVPAAVHASLEPVCPDLTPPPLEFADRVYIDVNRAGGEPVSIVAQDGSISVSAHAGTTHIYKDPRAAGGYYDFLGSYYNQTLNWRSTDGGRSWSYIGIAGLPTGPHSLTSTGFSDPDFAMDAAGRIYNTEIDLANVAVFSSDDDGQSYNLANPMVTAGDRPWLTAAEKDEVFLYVQTLKQLWRSTDAGITWSNIGTNVPIEGKMIVDPRNPKDGLIGPLGGFFKSAFLGVAISEDNGKTWTEHRDPGLATGQQFFGMIAVDKAGHVYAASAGGYQGSGDTTANGFVEFNYFDRDAKQWGTPMRLDIPEGDALWPWLTAGDDGRVGLAWLQNHKGDPEKFHIYAAYSLNGRGTTVTCDDGTTKFTPPTFSIANASKTPMHEGPICLSGTSCNATTNFRAGDRRLGDFFTVNFDKEGTFFIVSGDTTRPSLTGGPKPVGNPIFIRATGGEKLLEEPVTVRKSRCIGNLPLC